MLYHQLRIFVFMVVAMVRLSAAAHFNCDNSLGYIYCEITLNSGNDFYFSEQDLAVDCTRDGKYCARVESISNDNTEWKIVVQNNGAFCYAVCPFQHLCDSTCYDQCETDAC
jgi:hypothetical protein